MLSVWRSEAGGPILAAAAFKSVALTIGIVSLRPFAPCAGHAAKDNRDSCRQEAEVLLNPHVRVVCVLSFTPLSLTISSLSLSLSFHLYHSPFSMPCFIV